MVTFEVLFKQHRGRHSSKWQHYFEVYNRHLTRFCNQSITLLEIGVGKGGSLQIWKKFLGPEAKIIGIDIDPELAFLEPQIQTFTGSQSDTSFLQSVIDRVGKIDVVIDDGSHVQSDILTSFELLYPVLSNGGVYIIEDCHTSYWPRFQGGVDSHMNVVDIMSRSVHDVNSKWFNKPKRINISNLDSMHFYDSMIVFEKRQSSYKRMMVDVDSNGPRVIETV